MTENNKQKSRKSRRKKSAQTAHNSVFMSHNLIFTVTQSACLNDANIKTSLQMKNM